MPEVPAPTASRFVTHCIRLVRDDAGQDIIEYALLAAFFGVAGYAVLSTLGPAVNSTYATWIDPSAGSAKLWDPEVSLLSSGS
ncbi:MAG: hypothetical protein ABIX28_10710 [Vicinamibacterales bacterium]